MCRVKILLSKKIELIFMILLLSMNYRIASAQQILQKEMRILKLFYPDKEIVITSTREPKPISKVAKNVEIITSKDIEMMNAHDVAEVLYRSAGIFLDGYSQDMGSPSFVNIYASERRHTLIMIDGMPINFHSEGYAELNSIPVDIIKRIEIIKGPASSCWGSSIGGVVNIITKDPSHSDKPKGYVRFSYGERYTYDTGAQISGTYKKIGYYIFAGKMNSDGMRGRRDFKRNSLYSKIRIPLSDRIDARVFFGYSDPENDLGSFIQSFPALEPYYKNHFNFLNAKMDVKFTDDLKLRFMFYHTRQKTSLNTKMLYSGLLYQDICPDEETYGGRVSLGYRIGRHSGSIGIDIERNDTDIGVSSGKALQRLGAIPYSFFPLHEEKWAVYANDNIDIGNFTIIPELRYEHNTTSGSFVNTGLGLAYRLGEDTILRAQFARGVSSPPLAWKYGGGGVFLRPNKGLGPERVLLYQIGAETSILKYFWLKGTAFRQEIHNYLIKEGSFYKNGYDQKKHGIEIQFELIPFYGFKIDGSYTFVHLIHEDQSGRKNMKKYTCGLRYNNYGIEGELYGTYIWWNTDSWLGGSYDNFIWDLDIKKRLSYKKKKMYIFFKVHNLFNGSQYDFVDRKNPRRWIESGFKIYF